MIKCRRLAIYEYYKNRFATLEAAGCLRTPHVPDNRKNHCWTFYLLLESGEVRDNLLAYLKSHGVSAVFHFVPLHLSPMGRAFGYREGDLPITEDLASRILRLPSFGTITRDQQNRVVDLITAYLNTSKTSMTTSYSLLTAHGVLEGIPR